MAHFLFVDESGNDLKDSPNEVLAGLAIEDRNLWDFIQSLRDAEKRLLGCRYSAGRRELKGSKILKRKVFRLAAQMKPIAEGERQRLAKACVTDGASAGKREMTALAQAKWDLVKGNI